MPSLWVGPAMARNALEKLELQGNYLRERGGQWHSDGLRESVAFRLSASPLESRTLHCLKPVTALMLQL